MAALLTPAVLLPILTGGAGVGGTLLMSGLMNWLKNRKAKVSAPAMPAVSNAVHSPVVQHILSGLAQNLVNHAQQTGHAALDAVVAQLSNKILPGSAPLVTPIINKVADELEKKVAGPQA